MQSCEKEGRTVKIAVYDSRDATIMYRSLQLSSMQCTRIFSALPFAFAAHDVTGTCELAGEAACRAAPHANRHGSLHYLPTASPCAAAPVVSNHWLVGRLSIGGDFLLHEVEGPIDIAAVDARGILLKNSLPTEMEITEAARTFIMLVKSSGGLPKVEPQQYVIAVPANVQAGQDIPFYVDAIRMRVAVPANQSVLRRRRISQFVQSGTDLCVLSLVPHAPSPSPDGAVRHLSAGEDSVDHALLALLLIKSLAVRGVIDGIALRVRVHVASGRTCLEVPQSANGAVEAGTMTETGRRSSKSVLDDDLFYADKPAAVAKTESLVCSQSPLPGVHIRD